MASLAEVFAERAGRRKGMAHVHHCRLTTQRATVVERLQITRGLPYHAKRETVPANNDATGQLQTRLTNLYQKRVGKN